MSIRPRRSVLYMPGSNIRALRKARELPADCLVFDLEDAVAVDTKQLAREQILQVLAEGGYGARELIVRTNAMGSPWVAEDIAVMANSAAHCLCLPKVETPSQVCEAVAWMENAGCPDGMGLWAMIETPLGVLNVAQIAQAHPRLQVIMMGTSDLVKELRAHNRPDRCALLYALGACVIAARAAGLDIIDGVCLDLDDEQALLDSCQQGRDMGFDGKSLIHPRQVAAANQAFAPSAAQLLRAQRIEQAWREAQAAGSALVVLDGQLIECLHVDEAQRLQQLAAAIDHLAQR